MFGSPKNRCLQLCVQLPNFFSWLQSIVTSSALEACVSSFHMKQAFALNGTFVSISQYTALIWLSRSNAFCVASSFSSTSYACSLTGSYSQLGTAILSLSEQLVSATHVGIGHCVFWKPALEYYLMPKEVVNKIFVGLVARQGQPLASLGRLSLLSMPMQDQHIYILESVEFFQLSSDCSRLDSPRISNSLW